MKHILLENAHIYTPIVDWLPGWLLTEGVTIFRMGPGTPPDFPDGFVDQTIDVQGQVLLPGFIDLHVHGAVGHDVMDGSSDAIEQMARFYASHGVTAFLATTWTASRQSIKTALEAIKRGCGAIKEGATLLGVHLEGPYLNLERCGAQNGNAIRRAERMEALEFLESGIVKLWTLAPEFPENLWLVDECVRRGIRVSAGHTSASYEEMLVAVQHGLRQVTHCFNAMPGLDHRSPGTVGAALSMPEISCELIADNIHVHPAVQKILVDVKSPAGVILITDAIRGAGLPDGNYLIDGRIGIVKNGAVRLSDGRLAGSILTMDRALENIFRSTGRSLNELCPMASLNAAQAIGVSNSKGSLEPGKDADLVLLDSRFNVLLTMVNGEIVWNSEATPRKI
jgi:N-acetylglucosamine-6-phosphate deacetylase